MIWLRRSISVLVLGFGVVGAALAQQAYLVTGSPALETCLDAGAAKVKVDVRLAACAEQLRTQGYLEFSIDSSYQRADTVVLLAHEGPRYALGAFDNRLDTSDYHGPVLRATFEPAGSVATLNADLQDYLRRGAQAGYPFTHVRFDSLAVAGDSLSGKATTWSGPLVTYGGVRFGTGVEPPVSERFLSRYLRVEEGRRYRQSEITELGRRLRGLAYLELVREPVVIFESGEAMIYLDARVRKTSRFDFLLGFLPNSEQNEGQLLLTGDATLELDNSLKRGERLFFSFERLQPQSTEIQLQGSYPYLFDSPFGARVEFGLYRQQEDWLRVTYEAGLNYSFGGGDAYEFFYEGGVAQALGFDTVRVRSSQRLPEVLDARRNGFGVRLRLDRRDDLLDTRRGYRLVVDGVAALREVTVTNGIRELGEALALAADSVGGRTAQYRIGLDATGFYPLGKRFVAVARARGGILFGQQEPLRNELYRIGGQRLLRGFDEQSIDAQGYVVGTAEVRLLIGGGSFLFAFTDQGYLRDPYRFGASRDAPTGFGAGLRLGTGAGALSLTYAYGRREGAPVDFQRAKIHIGFESRF